MSDSAETAILAGGCYWIMQQLLRDRDGVISTRVGWTGGENDNPTEENNSGHAEAVEVTFDLERISYRELLEYFFQVHRADLGERLVGSALLCGAATIAFGVAPSPLIDWASHAAGSLTTTI